jgi:hypothetical protein
MVESHVAVRTKRRTIFGHSRRLSENKDEVFALLNNHAFAAYNQNRQLEQGDASPTQAIKRGDGSQRSGTTDQAPNYSAKKQGETG